MEISGVRMAGSRSEPVALSVRRKPASDAAPTQDGATLDSTDEQSAADGATTAGDPAPSTESPSGIKSFTYGALGITPDAGQTSKNDSSYSAGQWTGAALKVGGIIALLA